MNVTRGECVCVSQDDVNDIIKLINRDQEVKNFRIEIINGRYDDGDDIKDD